MFLPPSIAALRCVFTLALALSALLPAPSSLGDAPGPSSRRTAWIFSEILPRPAPRTDGRSLEFVEIGNTGLIAEDLGGHRVSGDIDYLVPAGTVVPPGGFVVIARDPVAVTGAYGITNVIGGFASHLSDRGTLRLSNPAGALLLEVGWAPDPPWPAAAGAGASLVLAHPSYGEADPRAWSASALIGGSPGRRSRPRRTRLRDS